MIMEYLVENKRVVSFSEVSKFLYVKNPKVAGTSIKQALAKVPGYIAPSYKRDPNYREIFGRLNDEKLKTYFKFTFVRNPWDRTVSLWNYFTNAVTGNERISKCSFREFLENNYMYCNASITYHAIEQYKLVECNGIRFLDFIGKLENIDSDWEYVSKIIHTKPLSVSNKCPHKEYTKYYDDWCIEKVANIYAKDIEMFGYQFGK